MSIHETYVSLEVAKLLKLAGFDWRCDTFYGLDVRYKGKSIDEDEEYELKVQGRKSEIEYVQGGRVYSGFYHSNKKGEDYNGYSRPSLDVAQRWLREVKRFNIVVEYDPCSPFSDCYYQEVTDMCERRWYCGYTKEEYYSTYEEALEAGIKKVLELILEREE